MTTQGGLGLRQSEPQFKTHDGETVNATQPEGVTVTMIVLWMMGAKWPHGDIRRDIHLLWGRRVRLSQDA